MCYQLTLSKISITKVVLMMPMASPPSFMANNLTTVSLSTSGCFPRCPDRTKALYPRISETSTSYISCVAGKKIKQNAGNNSLASFDSYNIPIRKHSDFQSSSQSFKHQH